MTKGNNTKDKIAKIAWNLFNEKGYDETTIDDILIAAKISKGSFYHYFSSKDELLSSLSNVLDSKYEEIIKTIDPNLNSLDKLLNICYLVHNMIGEEIPIGLLSYLYSSQVVTKGDKHLLNPNRYYFRLINQLVEEGQQRGQIRDDLDCYEIVHIFVMCERAIIYDYCISNGNYSLGEYTKKTMPIIFGSVRSKKS